MINRRQLIKICGSSAIYMTLSGCSSFFLSHPNISRETIIKIGMLHINPKLGDMDHNVLLIEKGMRLAASHGAQWILTPELSLTGYRFKQSIGTDWISVGPDRWTRYLQSVSDELNVYLFLSHLEQPVHDGPRFNTAFVINPLGDIIARHHKVNIIPGAESWSSPGESVSVVNVGGVRVGLLICADAWPMKHAKGLKEQGAEILLSFANWPPGQYGPGDSWEKRSGETGLPLFVCNRTGKEGDFDMSAGKSVVSLSGSRLYSHHSDTSTLLVLDWDRENGVLLDVREFDI